MSMRSLRQLLWVCLAGFASGALAVVFAPAPHRWLAVLAVLAGCGVAGLLFLRSAPAERSPLIGEAAGLREGKKKFIIPHEIPAVLPALIGREREVQELVDYLTERADGPHLAVISGAPGVGKTSLAITVAHLVSDQFKGGQFFFRLPRPADPGAGGQPKLADLKASLHALGMPARGNTAKRWIPGALAKTKVLVILDDVNDADDVHALLPADGAYSIIVTASEPMPEIGPHHHLRLSALESSAALALFTTIVGQERVGREASAAWRIVSTAEGNPFVLQTVGAFVALRHGWRLEYVTSLLDQNDGPIVAAEPHPHSGFDLIYALLTRPQRQLLSSLGALGAQQFEPWLLKELMNGSDERQTTQAIDGLARIGLLERVPDASAGRPVFLIPEQTAAYAKRLFETEADPATQLQVRDQVSHARAPLEEIVLPARDIRKLLDKGRMEEALNKARIALAWAQEAAWAQETSANQASGDTPGPVPQPATRVQASHGGSVAGSATAVLAELHMELALEDAEYLAKRALALGGPGACAPAHRALALLDRRQNRLASALENLVTASQDVAPDEPGEMVRTLRDLAVVQALTNQAQTAIETIDRARILCLQHKADEYLLSGVLWASGAVLAVSDSLAEAERSLLACATFAGERGSKLWVGWADHERARVLLMQGRLSHARDLAFRAMDHFTDMRHRYGTGQCRLLIGKVLLAENRLPDAALALEEAKGTFRTCNDRRVEAEAGAILAEVRHRQRPYSLNSVLTTARSAAVDSLKEKRKEPARSY